MPELVVQSISQSEAPTSLLLDADPSMERIGRYLPSSQCFAAKLGSEIVGVCVLERQDRMTFELMNIAVAEEIQEQGVGTKLLQHAIDWVRAERAKVLLVGTGSFGDQLIFYHKLGFRVIDVWRDHFTDHYPEPIFENGIQHRDMLRLALELSETNDETSGDEDG